MLDIFCNPKQMYAFCFTVPESELEKVKEAIFAAGAGKIGKYSHGSWQVLGEGQFKPLPGSQPAIGEINKIEKIKEYKVETICQRRYLKKIIKALKKTHPYETPSYQFWKIASI
jgi:structural toxin protein (hemagglutinin/hemolysin) RtxA